MAWNRKHHVNGHVWGERFFSAILDSIRAYRKTFLYVAKNPASARLVGAIDEWRYGGLWHFKRGDRDILGELPGFAAGLYDRLIAPS
jgi:hypothetical protein